MINELSRRRFLSQAGIGVSAAWVSAHWPEMVAAATHAHQAVQSSAAYKFEFFTPAEATEIAAISARIIPTDDTPGAREAGRSLFYRPRADDVWQRRPAEISRWLTGIAEPGTRKVSWRREIFGVTPEQQDELLHAMEASQTEKAYRVEED